MIRCMAPIVPLGTFINQLHPNPHTHYYEKSAWKNSVEEREGEKERGRNEKVIYSSRDKMNREWQRHQERSGKIALTRRFIAVHVYVKTSWLSFALKQSKIAWVWKFWERKHRWQIIAFNAGRTPIPNSRGSVVWCRDYGAEKKHSGKSLSSV